MDQQTLEVAMLYRNPDPIRLPATPGPFRRLLSAIRRRRRQRRATLDLMGLSPHRRRDLGLEDFPFGGPR